MQILPISSTIIDTNSNDVPFIPSYTIGVMNATGAAISLQHSDTDSGFSELAVIPATGMKQVTLSKRYLKAATGIVYAFGN